MKMWIGIYNRYLHNFNMLNKIVPYAGFQYVCRSPVKNPQVLLKYKKI